MYPVFESIRICEGRADNLSAHRNRMQRTAKALWDVEVPYDGLQEMLGVLPEKGLYKCRVDYFRDECHCQLRPYIREPLHRLFLVADDELHYPFKFSDRRIFDSYRRLLAPGEDILFVQNGQLTDSLYANIILWNGQEWHTPATPLLPGTRRQTLIDRGEIKPVIITPADLQQYSRISLINAMLNPGDRVLNIHGIEDGSFLQRKS